MRRSLSVLTLVTSLAACAGSSQPTPAERAAIAATIEQEVKSAYDLKAPDPVKSFERLYPDTGRIVSASGGQMVTSRDSLFASIATFWKFVGSNMKDATWMWDHFAVDVLSRDAAVMTATYHVPHMTPDGHRHVIGGAWTAAFRHENGRWVIVQEHLSDLPMAMADSAHAHMNMPMTRPDTGR